MDEVRHDVLKIAACALLAAAALEAGAQNASPASLWYEAGHVALTVGDDAQGLSASWQFDRADNGDVRIVKAERRGAAAIHGTVLSVCGDQALAFKDIVPDPQGELRELDEPVLHLQLALRLLARALPQGPMAVGQHMSVDLKEDKARLQVGKGPRTRRQFDAPWRVRGSVNRGAGGDFRFDFDFAYGGGARMILTGAWARASGVPRLGDDFSLAGWRVHRVDTVAEVTGGNTVLDNVARARPLKFTTLGELRAQIEQRWDSGPRAQKHFECTR